MAAPLVPPEVDLRGFDWFPLFRRRLFASRFHRLASPAEWRAGVILWIKSWDEVPAGSLPNDDRELAALAEVPRDLREWKKIRKWAMHGWELADDGRLYHPTVAEMTLEAWGRMEANRQRTAAARKSRWQNRDKISDASATETTRPDQTLIDKTNPLPRAHANGHAREAEKDLQINGVDPVRSLRSPARSASPIELSPLAEQKRQQLTQKLMRFANATMRSRDRSAAINGLMGEDQTHDAQWWLDSLDRKMRAQGWDDTRGQDGPV